MKQATITIIAISLIIIGIILIFIAATNLTGGAITGQATGDKYSYTKAICNETSCQDYEVQCEGAELTSLAPTGKVVQFSEDWEDPRDEETIGKLC